VVTLAVTSGKGSPGVTTTVLALAMVWPEVHPERTALVIDADPAGSGITMGFLQGRIDVAGGLVPLAARRPPDPVSAVWAELVALDTDGRVLLLPGIPDSSLRDALEHAWSTVATAINELGAVAPEVDVLIDLGRLPGAPPRLLDVTDRAVVVTQARLPVVPATRRAVRTIRDTVPSVDCVVVGTAKGYSAAEIGAAVDAPVLAVLPNDPDSAAVLSDGSPAGWRFKRSPLMRSARAMAAALLAAGGEPSPPVDHGVPTAPAEAPKETADA
jgi:MinD-like ATPase involved in chromosome partitioning or flagellar assembly